jgi:hypothetical protein
MRYVCIAIILWTGACAFAFGQGQRPDEAQTAVPAFPDNPSVTTQTARVVSLDLSPLHSSGGRPPVLAVESQVPQQLARTGNRSFVLLTVFQAAATIGDIESTQLGLSHGAREANPLAGERPSRAELYAISLPISAGVALWSHRLKKMAPHSKCWMIPPIIFGTGHTGAAIYNFQRFH